MSLTLAFDSIDTLGTGDAQSIYNATVATRLKVRSGTAAAPDTAAHPPAKIERTVAVADGDLTGDGSEQLAGLTVVTVGTSALAAQSVGIFAGAKHSGTTLGSGGRLPDACAFLGTSRITGVGTGTALGAAFYGRRDTDTGKTCGMEAGSLNYTATAGAYNSTGFSNTTGIWVNAGGDADSGVGLSFGNPFSRQFKVGIGFNAQVTGGLTGGIADACIRDDSNSVITFDVNGSHTDILNTQGATISGKLFKINVPGTYTATNVVADRAYDADATTTAELADVLGTLIADLRTLGLVA